MMRPSSEVTSVSVFAERRLGPAGRGVRRRPPWRARSRAASPTPAGVIITFSGLRSRCTIPLSCAAASPRAICTARSSRVAQVESAALEPLRAGSRPRRAPSRCRCAPRPRRPDRTTATLGCVMAAAERASRRNRCRRSSFPAVGQQLERHVAPQLLVLGAVDDAHAAVPEDAEDAELRDARGDGVGGVLRRRRNRSKQRAAGLVRAAPPVIRHSP